MEPTGQKEKFAVVAVITHLRVGQTAMVGAPLLFALIAAVILLISKGNKVE
jgi:hypothetical protein